MWRFRGNINGSVLSQSQPLPMLVENISLVNKGAGAGTINVYALYGSQQICVIPLNKSVSAGSSYESIRPFVLLATEQIKIQTDGSFDYDCNISNTEAPNVDV